MELKTVVEVGELVDQPLLETNQRIVTLRVVLSGVRVNLPPLSTDFDTLFEVMNC